MDTMNYGKNDECFPEPLENASRFYSPAGFGEEAAGTEPRISAASGDGQWAAPGTGVYGYAASDVSAQQPASGFGASQYAASGFGASQYSASGSGVYAAQASGRYDRPSSGVYSAAAGSSGRVRTAGSRREKRRGLGTGVVALALCCSLLGGAAGAGGVLLAGSLRDTGAEAVSTETGNGSARASAVLSGSENGGVQYASAPSAGLLSAEEVYERNVESTVGITTEITTTNFWGYRSTAAASGSGFLLTEDGYILTNHHVIEGASAITVTAYDGTSYAARLIGSDVSNDIAVLKIEAEGLRPVTLGSSDALRVGQDVMAIGNPLGELTFSLTKGVVSALSREVTMSNGVTMNLIQTDCAINSGNSGGALFNLYGEVVGITNAKYSSGSYASGASIDNIGFAIPIDSVRDIVTGIIERGGSPARHGV